MQRPMRTHPQRPPRSPLPPEPRPVLGVEGGGTRTTVILAGDDDAPLAQFELGPANLKLLSDRELIWRLKEIAARLPVKVSSLGAVAIGLAGTRTEADRDRVRRAASRVFPKIPCLSTDDLETALAATPAGSRFAARVLVLSGTGSCCFGKNSAGKSAKAGGRGHVLGDRGSACDIGLRALRELVAQADRSGRWPLLGALILDALALTTPDELIDWSMQSDKTSLGSLSIAVFRAAEKRDPLARRILAQAADALAEDALSCARRLAPPAQPVQFVFNGGVLLKNPAFARDLGQRLRRVYKKAAITPVPRPSAWGAVELARSLARQHQDGDGKKTAAATRAPSSADTAVPIARIAPRLPETSLQALAASPTEQRNPRSTKLSSMPLGDAVKLMLDEESRVPAAILRERAAIVAVVEHIIAAFKNGGHLFYVGAGTSGRLGVLDASECPPTFRAPREQVQGIIAGGQRALWSAVEGAEDDAAAGADAIIHRKVSSADVVIGIAASGRTPYVWGALAEAARRRATTALVCFNPGMKTALKKQPGVFQPDLVIAPDLGPEVLTGSTRLKAGTATKLLLNIFTTLAMSRVGKVLSNLMIDLNPSNVKLRDRAERIISELNDVSRDDARAALEASGWIVKTAYESLLKKK